MKVAGFGDYLIHFSPVGDERFLQADSMKMSFTGAEANVCAALAMWGMEVSLSPGCLSIRWRRRELCF